MIKEEKTEDLEKNKAQEKIKKNYSKPQLESYGSVAELTKSGGSKTSDFLSRRA
jgi:hypothetical protein